MEKYEMRRDILIVVSLICDELTDLELAVLNNVAQLDMLPYNHKFDYEQVKELFTENNGTKIALAAIVMEGLVTKLRGHPRL